jgi:hypothetical protein
MQSLMAPCLSLFLIFQPFLTLVSDQSDECTSPQSAVVWGDLVMFCQSTYWWSWYCCHRLDHHPRNRWWIPMAVSWDLIRVWIRGKCAISDVLLPSNQSIINSINTSISCGSVIWGWFWSCFLILLHHVCLCAGRGHWRKWCPSLHMWGQDGQALVYLMASYFWMIFPTGRILWMNLVINVRDLLVIQFEMAWGHASQSIEQYSSKDHPSHSER